ncbi:M16 family metallopeptidase [Extensimonas sp. H3M7-6]|uniref:M16 family metallopeptidase n=1 Tax=Extensimonas soli TaxID=3031322 RepID=UPI0023DBD0A3|nr:pitrilysin family protein [Extensimonas sp. H3M7-6]MDF1480534.1 pitrilysin family protein [Extensimonas sp. H3M7-6]
MQSIKRVAARALFTGAMAVFGINPAWALLPIEHWTQPSGAQVWLVQSPSLPMLDVRVDFDAGKRRDPAPQAGLAEAVALMASKGVQAGKVNGQDEAPLDENALGAAWADLGANFGAAAGDDALHYSLRSLTEPALLERAVRLAARQIGTPSWPEDVWQRERARWSASIKEAHTRPGTLAEEAFATAVYGSHPYGYHATEESLARIGVADMVAFHARYLAPCRARVSLVGAVTRAQADALVATLLSRLPTPPQGCAPLPPVPEVTPLAAAKEIKIPFASAQAHVLIGQPGIARRDPDFLALLVGNHILGGGGLVSRLTEEVREKRGLSYSVYSQFNPGLHAGAFVVGLQTRPDQAAQAVQVAQDVLRRYVAQGPTEAELRAAKDNLIGGFALRIDSNSKLLANVANIAWNDLPLDYLEQWTKKVQALTVADVRAALQRKLQPERMVTVIVGGQP